MRSFLALLCAPALLLATDSPKGMPAWVGQEDSATVVGSVGTAAIIGNDRHAQRQAAVADGRLKLVAKVAVRTHDRLESLKKKAGEAAAAVDATVVERVALEASKALGTSKLGRVSPSQMWNNPDDRSIYVYLTVEAASLDKWVDEAVETQLKREAEGGTPVQPLIEALKAN